MPMPMPMCKFPWLPSAAVDQDKAGHARSTACPSVEICPAKCASRSTVHRVPFHGSLQAVRVGAGAGAGGL
jgi:hypothetical protein